MIDLKTKDHVKENVKHLLADNELSRNHDILLYRDYLYIFHGIIIDAPDEVLLTLPSPSSIVRARASVQNDDNMFLPTDPQIREERKISEEVWREWCNREARWRGL